MKTLIELRIDALLARTKLVNSLEDAGYTGVTDGVAFPDLVDVLSNMISGEAPSTPLNVVELSCHQTQTSGEACIGTGYMTTPIFDILSYFIPVNMYNCSYSNAPIEQISYWCPETVTVDEARVATYRMGASGESTLTRIDEVSLGPMTLQGEKHNRLILPRPISGELGCFPAIALSNTSGEAHFAIPLTGFVASKNYTAVHLLNSAALPGYFGDDGDGVITCGAFSIRSYGKRPDLVSLGNSLSMGKGAEDDTTRGIENWMQAYEAQYFVERVLNNDYYVADHIAAAYGWTYCISGKRTLHGMWQEFGAYNNASQAISARFPRYVMFMFGANTDDLYYPEESANILSNLIDLTLDIQAVPIVIEAPFAGNGSDLNAYIPAQNAGLKAATLAKSGAHYIEVNPVICPDGYIPAEYIATDNLHMILAGHQALSAEILRQMQLISSIT